MPVKLLQLSRSYSVRTLTEGDLTLRRVTEGLQLQSCRQHVGYISSEACCLSPLDSNNHLLLGATLYNT